MYVRKNGAPTMEQTAARKEAVINLLLNEGGPATPTEQELNDMTLFDIFLNTLNYGITDRRLRAEITVVDRQFGGGGKKRKSKRKKRKSHKRKSNKHKSKKHKSRRIRRR